MTPERKINPIAATIIVIVIVVGITVGILVLQRMNKTEPTNSTTTTSESAVVDTATTSSGTYKDGTYTETGTYATPGGREDITITVTLADNKVASISAEGSATRGESAQYQEQFLNGYKQYVEGKDVDTVSLSRVSGSSLTSDGFNKALEAIKVNAEA